MKRPILTLLILLSTLPPLSAQTASQLFKEGRDAFSDKLFSRSIESFREFIKSYPSDPRVDQADYMIGVSLFYLKKFNQTISHFNRYERDYPGSAYLRRIHYWKGLSYYGQENYRSAIGELRQQAEIKEELYFRQKSLQLLGYSYEKTQEYTLAADSYKLLFDSSPGENLAALALERQGYLAMEGGEYQKALDFFDKVSVEYSHVPQVLREIPFYQGECYYALKDYNASLRKFETFLSLYSSSENREMAVFRLGTLHALLKNQDDAKEYMSLLTNDYPDSEYIMQAHIILAESYMADGNMTAARDSLERLLENEKDPVEIQKLQFNMARSWEEEPDEALKWYLSASRGLDPDISGESLYRAGIIYENKNQSDRTVLLFEKLFNQYKQSEYREETGNWIVLYYENNSQDLALKNHLDRMLGEYPESEKRTVYLYMRGNISYREGKYNEALRYYQNILNVETEDQLILDETRYRIGYIYTLRKEYYRATDYFQAVLKGDDRGEAYYRSLLSLGICYLNVKENDKAEARFLDVLKGESAWSEDARFYLGKIQMDKGNYEQAAKYYKTAYESSENLERKIQSLYQLGWSYMRLASFDKAAHTFDTLWNLDQSHNLSADSLYRAGTALSYLEEWEESLVRYRKALEIIEYFSLREELLYQTAWSYFMLMKIEDAVSYLAELEKEFPGSPLPADGLFRAAESFTERGEIDASIRTYRILYENYNSSPLAETSLYRALSLSSDRREKLNLINEFMSRYTGSERALQAAGQLAAILEEGNTDEQERILIDEILRLNLQNSERTVILLAQYYTELDQGETLEKLNQLSGTSGIRPREVTKIQLYKGISHYNAGNPEDAAQFFDKVMDGDFAAYGAEALFYTASMLEDGGDAKSAADEFLRIQYRYPGQKSWVEKALYRAVLAYRMSGNMESARRTTEMLSQEYPESEYLKMISREEASSSRTEASTDAEGSDLEELSPPDEILPMIEE